ncbi:TIGR04222 domain-containing membrane protein [Kitasatospora sp. NPDC056651]|uniref:TIGR04222 domain-containing membrane protein n=1 Tax=Kitasatospora sp. NPDC056651 TaxID=3345892 RepID=UPI0036C1757E
MWVVLILFLVTGTALAVVRPRARAALHELYRAEQLAAGREFDLGRDELACLAGHLADLKILEMHGAGLLVASRSGDLTLTTPPAGPQGVFEEEAARQFGPTRTRDLREVLASLDRSPPAVALRDRLPAQGLHYDDKLRDRVRRIHDWTAVVLASVTVAGVASLVITLARHENGLVPLVPFAALFAAAWLVNHRIWMPLSVWGPRTGLGVRVLAEARPTGRRYGPAAVALDGLSALPAKHDLRICYEASLARARKRAPSSHYGVGFCGMGCGGGF